MVLNAIAESLPTEQALRFSGLLTNLSQVWEEVDKEWLKIEETPNMPDGIRPREKGFSIKGGPKVSSADARVGMTKQGNELMNNLIASVSSSSQQTTISAFSPPPSKKQPFSTIKSRLDAVLTLARPFKPSPDRKNKSQSVFIKQ